MDYFYGIGQQTGLKREWIWDIFKFGEATIEINQCRFVYIWDGSLSF